MWFTFILCATCIGISVVLLMQGPRQEVRFTPPPFDPAAVPGVPELTSADGYGTIDATVYRFSACGTIALNGDSVDVWFTNHAENEAWLKLVLKDENDSKLGETGLIRPDEYVQSITLTTVPTQTCPVRMIVMGYEPETYLSVGNVTLQTELQIDS